MEVGFLVVELQRFEFFWLRKMRLFEMLEMSVWRHRGGRIRISSGFASLLYIRGSLHSLIIYKLDLVKSQGTQWCIRLDLSSGFVGYEICVVVCESGTDAINCAFLVLPRHRQNLTMLVILDR